MLTTRMRLSVLLLLLEKEESHTHKRMPPSPPWSKRGERGRGNGRGQERGGRERHEAGARETQRQERRTTPDASLEKIAGNALDKAGVQRCTIECDAYSVVRKVCYIFKMVTQDVHDQAQTLAVWRIQYKRRFLRAGRGRGCGEWDSKDKTVSKSAQLSRHPPCSGALVVAHGIVAHGIVAGVAAGW